MRLLIAAALASSVLVAGAGPAVADTTGSACTAVSVGQTVEPVVGASEPLRQLEVARAQEILRAQGTSPGDHANVAVVDSGVYDGDRLDVIAGKSFTGRTDLIDAHGTAVAGVIAGKPREDGQPVGIAPGARILDVRVYDTGVESVDETEHELDPGTLADGLEWLAKNARSYDVEVVNVSLAFDRDYPSVRTAVQRLWRKGVIVVAASGNRPDEEGEPGFPDLAAPMKSGEDAAGLIYPAAYPHVIAVNASARTGQDVTPFVLQNSDTDLAAPTVGLVSVAVTGDYCVINELATSWSAAVVSGVLSLLRSAYPNEEPAQTVARLLETANGTAGTPTRLTGQGVVQPLEALTRPLNPAEDGTLAYAAANLDQPQATAPEPADDLLAGPRDDAVWWGLIGGGLLVVALLLRPLLSRRR